MLTIRGSGSRLCDGLTRRDILHAGGLGMLGLSLPELLRQRALASSPRAGRPTGRAKSCILLFLLGGPDQHSTWDPKPDTPPEIRGEFRPIATRVPGMQFGELMPRLAQQADKLAVLRAVCTNDNAHSSSGYFMLTGQPHVPTNVENGDSGPNKWPCMAAVVQRLRGSSAGPLPGAVLLPHRIFNSDNFVWSGQNAGFLGRNADPWLLRCEPASPQYRIPEFSLSADVPMDRLQGRLGLLDTINQRVAAAERSGVMSQYDHHTHQAFDLLRSSQSRNAFSLDRESMQLRDRYGRSQFGQSVLLARRLVEAGVSLVQVNWYRGPEEPADNPCWDTHAIEPVRLKTVLLPPFDQAFSALLEDLSVRGLLEETLVVCLAEFGRTPRFNARGGREHWGHVFSIAMAGGGIRGGVIHGASDAIGGYPRDGAVTPQDVAATIFHCLGYSPDTEVHDTLNRPFAISRGQVIRQLF